MKTHMEAHPSCYLCDVFFPTQGDLKTHIEADHIAVTLNFALLSLLENWKYEDEHIPNQTYASINHPDPLSDARLNVLLPCNFCEQHSH